MSCRLIFNNESTTYSRPQRHNITNLTKILNRGKWNTFFNPFSQTRKRSLHPDNSSTCCVAVVDIYFILPNETRCVCQQISELGSSQPRPGVWVAIHPLRNLPSPTPSESLEDYNTTVGTNNTNVSIYGKVNMSIIGMSLYHYLLLIATVRDD
jgi:hypothetical protein